MDSDLEDNWLFDSIRKYKSLYMYNLQKAVQSADWITEESLVVCISDDRTNELLELSLPAHLSVDEANSGLTKDRDFELIAGGFSERCITSLCHLQNTRKVVATVRGNNSVEVWQLQTPDNNLTKKIGVINNRISTSTAAQVCVVEESQVLFGSHLSDVCLADLNSASVVSHLQAADMDTDSPLTSMVQQDRIVWTSDRNTGRLISLDPQTGLASRVGSDLSVDGSKLSCHQDRSRLVVEWSDSSCVTSKEGVISNSNGEDSEKSRIKSKVESDGCGEDSDLLKSESDLCHGERLNGQEERSDLNGQEDSELKRVKATASDLSKVSDRLEEGEVSEMWTLCGDVSSSGQCLIQMSTLGRVCVWDLRNLKQCVMSLDTKLRTDSPDIHISVCPTEPNLLATTGFSGCVQVFDRDQWQEGREATPVFVHDGHMAERTDQSQYITTNIHLWYPWKHKTLLSASSDGGLHIFKPVL